MAHGRLRLLPLVPGAADASAVLVQVASRGPVLVASLTESRLRALAPLAANLGGVELVSLGNLVARCLVRCGLNPRPMATRGLVEAAMAEACLGLDDASPFYGTRRFAGLHRRLVSVLDQLRDWRISPEAMRSTAELAEPELGRRLRSLATLEEHVVDTLERLSRTLQAHEMERCLEAETEPGARWEPVIVFADGVFSPLLVRWLRWLADAGAEVTVCTERHAAGASLFEASVRLEGELGVAAEPNGDGHGLARSLFGNAVADTGPAVVVESFSDPLAECEWAVRGCLRALAEGGDADGIVLMARDLASYAPLLQASAARLGLPLRLARRAPLPANGFARLTLEALAFCAGPDVRPLAHLVERSYLGLSREHRAELSGLATEAYHVGARQWEVLEEAVTIDDSPHGWLATLLAWRRMNLAEHAPLGSWSTRLRTLLESVSWPEASFEGSVPTADRDQRAQSALLRTLAQHASVDRVRDHRPLGFEAFARLCRSLCERAESWLPASQSGVRVVSTALEIGEARHVQVLGMLEGDFPRRRTEDPVLFDTHRAALATLLPHIPPLPDSHTAARAERDEFYRACVAPSQTLVLSYPETDEQRDNVPAFYLVEIARAQGERLERRSRARREIVPESGDRRLDADLRLGFALDGPRVRAESPRLRTPAARAKVTPGDQDAFRPRDIREAYQCPFRALARLRLGLYGPRSDAWWPGLRRLPGASRLAVRTTEADARDALLASLDAEIGQVRAHASPFDVSMLRLGGRRLVDELVAREFAAREQWPKTGCEAPARFGQHGLRGALQLVGGILLDGGVDAVSQLGPFRVAHLSRSRLPAVPDEGGGALDPDLIELGVVLLALWAKGTPVAIEVETPSDGRGLYLLPREGSGILPRINEGLHVFDLGSPKKLFELVKEPIRRGIEQLRAGSMDAIPGDACRSCSYGELCRRSREFDDDDPLLGAAP